MKLWNTDQQRWTVWKLLRFRQDNDVPPCWSITAVVACISDQSHNGKRGKGDVQSLCWVNFRSRWSTNWLSSFWSWWSWEQIDWAPISLHSQGIQCIVGCIIRATKGGRQDSVNFGLPLLKAKDTASYLTIFCIPRQMNPWDGSYGGKRWKREPV